jgi:excisionase family DNA binding protein
MEAIDVAAGMLDHAKRVLLGSTHTRGEAGRRAFEAAFAAGEQYAVGELGDLTCDTHEAAQLLGYSDEHVRRLLREGKLLGIAHGGRTGWRLSREYVLQLATRRPKSVPPAAAASPG